MLKLVFGILVIQVLMGSLASIISALCIGIKWYIKYCSMFGNTFGEKYFEEAIHGINNKMYSPSNGFDNPKDVKRFILKQIVIMLLSWEIRLPESIVMYNQWQECLYNEKLREYEK